MVIVKIFSKIILSIFTVFALSFINPAIIRGQAIFFQENFNDGNADGWEQYGKPNAWSVINGKYKGIVEPWSYFHATSLAGNLNWDDYSYEVEITGLRGPDRSVLFRYDENRSPKGYEIKYVEEDYYKSNIIIQKEGVKILGTNYNINSTLGETHKIKIEGIGNNIKIYFDDSLAIDVIDDENPLLNGKIGVFVQISGAGFVNETSYDNILVTDLSSRHTFDLPIFYNDRPAATNQQFKSAFWNRLTAAFDHVFKVNSFRPFTGTSYRLRDCLAGTVGISCYDSHNGTDFSKKGGKDIYSVAEGTVVFTSEHTQKSCTPNKGGFGCVVIVEYPDNIFGLYAHLDKIFVNEGNNVNANTILGVMGNTGCPSCGVHLHFGVIKPVGEVTSFRASKMTRSDWKDLLYQARPFQTPTPFGPVLPGIPTFRPSCTYRAPNGQRFSFQDPSGWKGQDTDPWSKPTSEGGCGIESPYLWKFDVGTSP